jgi:hypothetical protein
MSPGEQTPQRLQQRSHIDRDIERLRSTQQGVYGQLVNGCDIASCSASYAPPGRGVAALKKEPDFNQEVIAIAVAQSGERGFFELNLPPGEYVLCGGNVVSAKDNRFSRWGACLTLSLRMGAERHDWWTGPAGGLWLPGPKPK